MQAQILDLLADLRERYSLAMLFISHDLAVVSQVADRVAVMRHGLLLEEGLAEGHLSVAAACLYAEFAGGDSYAADGYDSAFVDAAIRPFDAGAGELREYCYRSLGQKLGG